MLRAHTARATAINILILASFVALAGARIVRVSSSPDGIDTTSLLDAVRDPDATRIVVLGYITVGHDFDAYVGKGLPVSRQASDLHCAVILWYSSRPRHHDFAFLCISCFGA